MDIPLGKEVAQPAAYDPTLLAPVPRALAREQAHLDPSTFQGWDDWTAYEVCWQDVEGRRHATPLQFRVPSDSPNLVESKSIKLYLNSLFFAAFDDQQALVEEVALQLTESAGSSVMVSAADQLAELHPDPGTAWKNLDREMPSSGELRSRKPAKVDQFYFTECFRSLCPVTSQPDWASVFIRCDGPELDPAVLCAYLYAFSEHTGFHEQCVEQILCDLVNAGQQRVAVYARYLRRGGIDINPYRTTQADYGIGIGRIPRQ